MNRRIAPCFASIVGVVLLASLPARAEEKPFQVFPYLQNPTSEAVTVRWLSKSDEPGVAIVTTPEGERTFRSVPRLAESLGYNTIAPEPGGPHPSPPYLHSVRISGLQAGTEYAYAITQNGQAYRSVFRTASQGDQPVRFILYSDSETEPESSVTPPVGWPTPKGSNRPDDIVNYVANQTVGYQENLKVIASRHPNFVAIAGDLVETGGEQRDWNEFWRHNAGDLGTLASAIPIFPALGNHENFAGPGGGYTAEGANYSTAKYLTYFESPSNGASEPRHDGRYYRVDYGPITFITLDSSDGIPHKTASDTNHNLEMSDAPDFNPSSEQYRWFERQLADAQQKSQFTFVQFHHTAFGSGPHSIPFGTPGFSGQSGIAMRVLLPLLFRYGVDVVFSGHDEMLERSKVTGMETRPDGALREHSIHFYDVGIGGDGLRGPSVGFDNPYRQFLAHENSPEVWNGRQLVSGGKHYGHVEVNVTKDTDGRWTTEIIPVHVFPLMDTEGRVSGWERRTYDDRVVINSPIDGVIATAEAGGIVTSAGHSSAIATISILLIGSLSTMWQVIRRKRTT